MQKTTTNITLSTSNRLNIRERNKPIPNGIVFGKISNLILIQAITFIRLRQEILRILTRSLSTLVILTIKARVSSNSSRAIRIKTSNIQVASMRDSRMSRDKGSIKNRGNKKISTIRITTRHTIKI